MRLAAIPDPAVLAAALLLLGGCHPCDPGAFDYTPLEREDWEVSTPEAEGLDRALVDQLYCDAAREETIFGVLVVKNGRLVAEGYFNEGSVDQLSTRQSVTKSFTSALVGIALDEGCLQSLDDKMIDFFPEVEDQIRDPRKKQITLRQMLQMRAGYPWEETDEAYFDALMSGDYLRRIVEFPLVADPGTEHHYSNLTSHWLGVIVARACETDLRSFGEEHLFSALDAEIGDWSQDLDGYYIGLGELEITARDMAKFGQLYLDEGELRGERILPAEWVRQSFRSYSEDLEPTLPGPNLRDDAYGFQWWMAEAGDHHVDFAWGHGGSFIFVVDALDLVVVVTADPFWGEHSTDSWRHEKAHLQLAARFLKSIP